jgi:hypothetical protein
MAQGANVGSYSAFVLADAIAEVGALDLTFCHAAECSRHPECSVHRTGPAHSYNHPTKSGWSW